MLRALITQLPEAELHAVLGGGRGELGLLVPELEDEPPRPGPPPANAIPPGCWS